MLSLILNKTSIFTNYMELRKKIKQFLVLGIIYTSLFHYIVPHHHHHAHEHDEIGAEYLGFSVDQFHASHNHTYLIHAHDYTWSNNNKRLNSDTFKCTFIHSLESIFIVKFYRIINYPSYKNITFNFLLLVNHSLRAPPSLG
jgi:hypothetical protein